MGTTLATKADLELMRTELRQEITLARKDMEILSGRIDARIDMLSSTITVRLGSMLIVGLGLLFGALKLT